MAGVSRLQYANEIRFIRVMCSGRVDLEFIFRAFSNGQDGVFIGGCRLNECNYITQGNYDALANTFIGKKILEHIGLNPERLRIEFMSSGDGMLLAEKINQFSQDIQSAGPIGQGEGLEPTALKIKLDAARKIVPYVRLVERERMRLPVKTKEAYHQFYESSEFEYLFDKLIVNRMAISQITTLLQKRPLSTSAIAKTLGLNPSEVSRHMNSSSRYGLVKYDVEQNCYALA